MTNYVCEYDYTTKPLDRCNITKDAKGYSPKNKEITEDMYSKVLEQFAKEYTSQEEWDKYTQQVNSNLWCFNYHGDVYFNLIHSPGLNAEQMYYGVQYKSI